MNSIASKAKQRIVDIDCKYVDEHVRINLQDIKQAAEGTLETTYSLSVPETIMLFGKVPAIVDGRFSWMH